MQKILHFYTSLSSLGGVESALKHHLALDASHGLNSVVALGCERIEALAQCDQEKACTLGIRGWHTLRHMRSRFARLIQKVDPQIVIYHNLWACRHLADLDQGATRVGMLHTDSDVSRRALMKCAALLDGLICVSPQIAAFGAQHFPSERIRTVSYPIAPPDLSAPVRPPLGGREIVIGFCGRLVIEQKRVDRLESIFLSFKATGVPCRLEILGEGPELEALRERLSQHVHVTFWGRKKGIEYWNCLRSWDFILFCSDYEGTPISLLEALSQGVIPIYPRIQSGGDAYVKAVSENLLFDIADVSAPARIVERLITASPDFVSRIREKCREGVRGNSLDSYFSSFRDALVRFEAMGKVGAQTNGKMGLRLLRLMPMYLVRRVSPHLIY